MTDMMITGVGSGQGLPQIKRAGSETTKVFEDQLLEVVKNFIK